MQQLVDQLKTEVQTSSTHISTLRFDYKVLLREHNNLQNAFNELKSDYDELEIHHKDLVDQHRALREKLTTTSAAVDEFPAMVESYVKEIVQNRLIAMFNGPDTSLQLGSPSSSAAGTVPSLTAPPSHISAPQQDPVTIGDALSAHQNTNSTRQEASAMGITGAESSATSETPPTSSTQRAPSTVAMPLPTNYPSYSISTHGTPLQPDPTLTHPTTSLLSPPESHFNSSTTSAISTLTPLPSAYASANINASVDSASTTAEYAPSVRTTLSTIFQDPALDVGTSISTLRIDDRHGVSDSDLEQRRDEDMGGGL